MDKEQDEIPDSPICDVCGAEYVELFRTPCGVDICAECEYKCDMAECVEDDFGNCPLLKGD